MPAVAALWVERAFPELQESEGESKKVALLSGSEIPLRGDRASEVEEGEDAYASIPAFRG